jgi:hypothetical protein
MGYGSKPVDLFEALPGVQNKPGSGNKNPGAFGYKPSCHESRLKFGMVRLSDANRSYTKARCPRASGSPDAPGCTAERHTSAGQRIEDAWLPDVTIGEPEFPHRRRWGHQRHDTLSAGSDLRRALPPGRPRGHLYWLSGWGSERLGKSRKALTAQAGGGAGV